MKHQLVTSLALILVMALAAIAADRPNFSGVWVMDRSRSEGIHPNMEQKMRVTHDSDKLELETDLFVNDEVNTVHDAYNLSGKEGEFTLRLAEGQSTTGKRVAKWDDKGDGFQVHEEATFDTPEGKATTTMVRKWTASADGKTLLIELNHNGPNGRVASKRTFTRK